MRVFRVLVGYQENLFGVEPIFRYNYEIDEKDTENVLKKIVEEYLTKGFKKHITILLETPQKTVATFKINCSKYKELLLDYLYKNKVNIGIVYSKNQTVVQELINKIEKEL